MLHKIIGFFLKICKIIVKIWKNSPLYFYYRFTYMLCLDFFVFFSKKKHPRLIRNKKQIAFKRILMNQNMQNSYKKIIEMPVHINDVLILSFMGNLYSQANFDNFRINYRLNFFKTGFYSLFGHDTNKFFLKKFKYFHVWLKLFFKIFF